MIGVFLKNDTGKLCFLQPPKEQPKTIQSFRYMKDSHLAMAIFTDGEESVLTTEIAPDLRASFETEKNILIVHTDDGVNIEREYDAKISAE